MWAGASVLWGMLAAHSEAAELDARMSLSDALLLEARGDLPHAVALYTLLSSTLPDDDPSLPEVLYWLGHGLYELGRVEDARRVLRDGVRHNCMSCRDMLEILEIEQASIRTTPVRWTFEGTHGLFHPWRAQAVGGRSIRIVTHPGADPALEWRTTPRPDEPDRLMMGLQDPSPSPSTLRVSILALDGDLMLDVVGEDDRGRRYALAEPLTVTRGDPHDLVVALSSLAPLDPQGPPLDPGHLVSLSLVDRTGMRAGGENTLWIDDFELR
jgi:hypothetical protein